MNSNPLFPFERNRYYSGKMLTSADFAAEQHYVNKKRNFLNHYMFGSGIVRGCNVRNIDDFTILVEGGIAIDSLGREIVIDTPAVKKISSVSGFEQTDSNVVCLCLRYKEELSQPVYSVHHTNAENEYEYNRIKEGYELFLKNAENGTGDSKESDSFLVTQILFQNEDYKISLTLPKTVCRNQYVKIQLILEKKSYSDTDFSYCGTIQMPAFEMENGSHSLDLEITQKDFTYRKAAVLDYWVFVREKEALQTNLILKTAKLKIQGTEYESEPDFNVKIMISDEFATELVKKEIGKEGLENSNSIKEPEEICLAWITLLRGDGTCIITNVDEDRRKYIEVPLNNTLKNEYLGFFKGWEQKSAVVKEKSAEVLKEYALLENNFKIATGVVEIPVGGKAKAGEVFYSGEVMHGLGTGIVYVEMGQEILEEETEGTSRKSTVYGNSKLFSISGEFMPKPEHAVKVLNDKGSFIAAVSFTQDTECLMLSYRWVAMKFAEKESVNIEQPSEKQWIEAETPTVVLEFGETYYFGIKFHEMAPCGIHYQVTEEDGGKISPDGIYTAPNKEGVYEIMISCMERPYICTYAYVIVKKK